LEPADARVLVCMSASTGQTLAEGSRAGGAAFCRSRCASRTWPPASTKASPCRHRHARRFVSQYPHIVFQEEGLLGSSLFRQVRAEVQATALS